MAVRNAVNVVIKGDDYVLTEKLAQDIFEQTGIRIRPQQLVTMVFNHYRKTVPEVKKKGKR